MASLGELLRAWLEVDDLAALRLEAAASSRSTAVRSAGAFLFRLAGADHGSDLLPGAGDVVEAIHHEMSAPLMQERLARAIPMIQESDPGTAKRALWSVFCPNAFDIEVDPDAALEEIRRRRRLTAIVPASRPIEPRDVLVTSNVLLTVPTSSPADGAQQWFDHPIPLDAEPNEIVHGIGALDAAVAFEKRRGVLGGSVPVVLSVSATHPAVEEVGANHVREFLDRPDHLTVYVFDERAVGRLLNAAFAPALDRLGRPLDGVVRVFGVAGPYGRHYSFLKAIAAVWHVLVDRSIRATFKIDLDQVFVQERLMAASGRSAFEILADDRWGGSAVDAAGRSVSLDFIAGALVNESDIARGLHIPDVARPAGTLSMDQAVFFSTLPQAVSTEAEMAHPGLRQRVHLTGGTTGATVTGLRRLRPFSPTFWGRAEDQAYALSHGRDAVSLHVHDLVMRHDNTTFATESVPGAAVAKVIGDHERILLFSAYARRLGFTDTEERLWPFTGAFVSLAPVTTAYVRLAATVLAWAQDGRLVDADSLARNGFDRLHRMRQFVAESFDAELDADRSGWNDLYDALDELEEAMADGEGWAVEARDAARRVVSSTRL